MVLGSDFIYIERTLWRVRAIMGEQDELFRNIPANIHELRLALAGLSQDMKVLAESEAGVSESTVEELLARTWPSNLVVTTPRKLRPKSVVKISKAT
jgi:alcohol dehydrogenase class IV